jgi:hypothetical protein
MQRTKILAQAHHDAEPYLASGKLHEAFTAFTIELKNHAETKDHLGIQLGFQMVLSGQLATTSEMRKYLKGFH